MSEVWNHYGPTAARPAGTPGRLARRAAVTIDVHCHVAVPAAQNLVAPHLDVGRIPLVRFATEETRALNRKQDQDRALHFVSHDQRLADMDAAGIDVQIVSPPPGQCYVGLPAEVAVPAVRMVNDGLAEFVARRPDRFRALGTVAMEYPDAAVAELERCMGSLGMKGVEILTHIEGRELSDPLFAPFWAAAERLGAVVMIHPNGFSDGARLSRYYFSNVIGNPLETTIALHYLIFDGVLERHPNLKILAVHGGGYLGAYPGRIDHAWGARSDCRGQLPHPPTSYFSRIYVDSVVFTPGQLAQLVETFGVGHVLMGTDYPFDMAEADPIGHIASVPGFDQATRAAIEGDNAARLFGITR
ncbi:MAG: amidohydrolase family protein [Rhodovarius sp.]|nr:amidohydrolase family protein [Rhodovarius sp.]MDW8313868.1 amidohydrolase family protein [Rhodovarius sp.]